MEQRIIQADAAASWNVVGHTYTPQVHKPNVFIWHAVSFDETFVPPYIQSTQDEWHTVLSDAPEIEFGADMHQAGPGNTVRLSVLHEVDFLPTPAAA